MNTIFRKINLNEPVVKNLTEALKLREHSEAIKVALMDECREKWGDEFTSADDILTVDYHAIQNKNINFRIRYLFDEAEKIILLQAYPYIKFDAEFGYTKFRKCTIIARYNVDKSDPDNWFNIHVDLNSNFDALGCYVEIDPNAKIHPITSYYLLKY